jgi:tRNA A-37 threonylcarbamoyl transferase component Bud32
MWGGEERLIIDFLADSRQFDMWWREVLIPVVQKRDMLRRLARIVATMHARGVRHRDLKSANIMIDSQFQPWIIDLAGASLNRSVSPTTREKDLARMARSARAIGMALTGYLIFFKAYCGNRLFPDWKKQWRQISRHAVKALALQQKRGRPAG